MRLHEGNQFEDAVWEDQQALFACRDARVIFDVGANIGKSVAQYARLFPQSRIFAFEPFPEAFRVLSDEFAGNHRIRPVNKAVSDSHGPFRFHLNEYADTNSLLPRAGDSRRYYSECNLPIGNMIVETVTLDEFSESVGVDSIDILKIDIQGGEAGALRGAHRLLSRQCIQTIFLEVFFVPHYQEAYLYHELAGLLQGYGYTLFNIYDMVRATNRQLRFADALFVSAPFRKEVVDSCSPEP
jgi:FkbM family methyltransferase